MLPPVLYRSSYIDTIANLGGVVGYWPCEESGGPVRDLSGRGGGDGTTAGTVRQGAPPAEWRSGGGALGFTAVAGSKVTGTGTNFPVGVTNVAWSFFAWVFMTTIAANSTHLFGFGDPADTNPGTGKFRKFLRFSSKIYFWGNSADLTGSVDYDVGKPQLIAATRTSAGSVVFSKNGVSVGSGSPGLVATTSQAWGIATKPYFGGGAELDTTRISHFAILNRTMTLPELAWLYSEGVG